MSMTALRFGHIFEIQAATPEAQKAGAAALLAKLTQQKVPAGIITLESPPDTFILSEIDFTRYEARAERHKLALQSFPEDQAFEGPAKRLQQGAIKGLKGLQEETCRTPSRIPLKWDEHKQTFEASYLQAGSALHQLLTQA